MITSHLRNDKIRVLWMMLFIHGISSGAATVFDGGIYGAGYC